MDQSEHAPFQKPKKNLSALKVVLLSILGLIVITAATVGILFLTIPRDQPTSTEEPNKQTAPALTSAGVISELQQKISDGSVTFPGVMSTIGDESIQPILVTSDTTYVQLTTTDALTVRSTTEAGFSATDEGLTRDGLAAFLEEKGFAVTTSTIQNTKRIATTNDVTCNIATTNVDEDTVFSFQLVCIDTEKTKASLNDVSAQLAAWTDKPSAASQLVVSSVSAESNGYTAVVSRVTVGDDTTPHSLVFVKEGESWTYIGDASQGESVESNELYVINADIKKGLDTPTYGPAIKLVLSK